MPIASIRVSISASRCAATSPSRRPSRSRYEPKPTPNCSQGDQRSFTHPFQMCACRFASSRASVTPF